MRNIQFRQMLAERQEKTKSLLCVGLDPLVQKLPEKIKRFSLSDSEKIELHMEAIVQATAGYTCMYKPNRAFYEAIEGGESTLRNVIKFINENYPDIPVFLDCKRGDIDKTQKQYGEAHFALDNVDGMNFNPYMGKSCLLPLVNKDFPGRALVGLCYTSNPDAREIQDLILDNGLYLWKKIAFLIMRWVEECGVPGVLENAGLVMAAAYENPKEPGTVYSEHLRFCRKIVVRDKLWFLIPGVGTQGGYVEETVKASYVGIGSIAVNSSSGIIFASQGDDFAEKAAEEAKKLKEQLWNAIPEEYLTPA